MKIRQRRFSKSAIIFAAIAMIFGVGFFALGQEQPDTYASGDAGRLITVYDRGNEVSFLTKAENLRGALAEKDIHLDSKDAVEPGLEEVLVASNYHVNIYRARPVTVIDGILKQRVMTPYQTAERIAADAKITIYPEDKTELVRSDELVGDGAGLQLIIKRATDVSLELYGKKLDQKTQAETVGEFLKEKNISLTDSDVVSPVASSNITSGMQIKVWREGRQVVTVEEEVAFTTEQVKDADRSVGYRQVKTAGENGLRSVTYEVVIVNGEISTREEIASVVTKQPRSQIEIVGSKVMVVGDRASIMAAAGIAESDYGYVVDILNRENALWCPTRWQGQAGCPSGYIENFPGAEGSNQIGYGLCQATPANKMASAGADWRTNPVTQLKWCVQYALGRYGSWQEAQKFSSCIGNCYSPYSKGFVIKRTRWW